MLTSASATFTVSSPASPLPSLPHAGGGLTGQAPPSAHGLGLPLLAALGGACIARRHTCR